MLHPQRSTGGLQSGGLQSGGLQSRSADFGLTHSPTAGPWSRSLQSGGLQSHATNFGPGNAFTHVSQASQGQPSGQKILIQPTPVFFFRKGYGGPRLHCLPCLRTEHGVPSHVTEHIDCNNVPKFASKILERPRKTRTSLGRIGHASPRFSGDGCSFVKDVT